MRARRALLIVPFLLVSLLPAAVVAASPSGVPTLPDAAVQHRAAVLAYWTPERMASAIPRNFVFDGARGGLEPQGKPAVKPTRPPKPTPTPTPSPSTDTLGAPWNGGGIMLTATGRVYFSMDGSNWICSGSVINDLKSGLSVVLTAGHCVVGNDGVFATYWMFIPSFDTSPTYTCAGTTYGCWVADALYADAAFASTGSFNTTAVQHDWGFAVVTEGGLSGNAQLDSTVGSLPIEYGVKYASQKMSAFGYPAAAPYTGNDLIYSRGTVGQDVLTFNTTWSLPSNLTGGASGGPWVQASDTTSYTDARAGSLNSYKYTYDKNHMYGPKFNSDTQTVFTAARDGTEPSGVVREVFVP